MMKISAKTRGWLLLVGGLALIWLGSYFRAPLLAHHRILVATPAEQSDVFKDTVIYVLRHDPSGGFGLILNKDGYGGPVEAESIHVLYSNDVTIEGGEVLPDTGLSYAFGEAAAAAVTEKKPAWSKVLKGYAGWGGRQLDREIRRGVWKVVDFDPKMVMDTPAADLHATAKKRPDADLDKTVSQQKQEEKIKDHRPKM